MADIQGQLSNPPPEEELRKIPGLPPTEIEAIESGDDRAEQEAKQLSSGRSPDQLKREAAEHEHDRTERFRDLFENCVTAGFIFGVIVAAIFGLTWTWHVLTPTSWHWLEEEQVAHIQNIFTGGVLASLLADHFRRRLS